MKSLVNYINENRIYEGFFNKLFKIGINVIDIVNLIRSAIKRASREGEETIYANIDPKEIIYDPKQKNIIYTGNDRSINKILVHTSLNEWLSKKEYKEYLDKFNKTDFGKTLMKYDPVYKRKIEQALKEKEAANAKDPVYNGKQLAKLTQSYWEEHSNDDYNEQWEWISEYLYPIIQHFSSDSKFEKTYAETIKEIAKISSHVNSNLNNCKDIKSLQKWFEHIRDKK